MLLIQNGHLLDPYTDTDAPRDILIGDNGRILSVAPHIEPGETPCYDASGLMISPGLVDAHVHFRDPGQTEKEDILTGAAAAAAGGYTTVVCMANTVPVCDNVDTLSMIREKARQAPIHVLQACAVTKGLQGKELTDFGRLLHAGAVAFTDDGVNLTDAGVCEQAMLRAVACDALLSFHEEDPALVPSPGVNFGSLAAQELGVPGAKASAEECMIARDIALALRIGARVCFQHVSSALSVQLIRMGKALGAHIYAEATPHHLALTEDAVRKYGAIARVNPPLRRSADRRALIEGLCDGTIDMIATDHAPHTAAEKARPFAEAPSGMIGLETAFSVCNTTLVQTRKLTAMELIRLMSKNPADCYGLKDRAIQTGDHAEFMLADWHAPVTYTQYRSKASNTPFSGMELTGKVRAVVMGTRLMENA